MRKNLPIRLGMYILGLLLMTLGIAVSVRSNLGVSPVSSIPYAVTCIFGMEMGRATILFHAALVGVQALLLRRKFPLRSLLQILAGVLFGYFTTFSNGLLSAIPAPETLPVRLLFCVGSAVLIALGVFLYVPTNLIPLAGEGLTLAVAEKTGLPFARVKVFFDCSMVVIALAACLIALHTPGAVGVGTVLAAVLVGSFVGLFTKLLGRTRDRLLGRCAA